jgi:DNA-binding HxlR family transcriptional regulator
MPSSMKPDVFNKSCESQQVLELIANKVTAMVIYALSRGGLRHGEVQRRVSGVPSKLLTQTLRNLERDGLVQRTTFPVVPPEYRLTPLGRTLVQPLAVLCEWATTHVHEVQAARASHDKQSRGEPTSSAQL